jgi:dTDP-4-dehydrorhamnose reductase
VANSLAQSYLENGRILVLGATGLLGTNVFRGFISKSETYGTYLQNKPSDHRNFYHLDASSMPELTSLIEKVAPTCIINCLGLADVEVCESRPEANWKINTEVPTKIAQLARARKIKFIQISTDHFYSRVKSPRSEHELVAPINQYGYAKFKAEGFILFCNPESLVLRTNFFGHSTTNKKSILDFALNSISRNQELVGFEDVVFSPVGISQITEFLLTNVSQRASGVLNFASGRPISKYEFMLMVARTKGLPESQIRRSTLESSSLQVQRPSYLALNPRRLNQEFNYHLPSVEEMIKNEIDSTL